MKRTYCHKHSHCSTSSCGVIVYVGVKTTSDSDSAGCVHPCQPSEDQKCGPSWRNSTRKSKDSKENKSRYHDDSPPVGFTERTE